MQAKAMSGKGQFPFLVDPNTGKQMLESDAIISYLWNEYGDGQVALCTACIACPRQVCTLARSQLDTSAACWYAQQ